MTYKGRLLYIPDSCGLGLGASLVQILTVENRVVFAQEGVSTVINGEMHGTLEY